MKLSFHSPFLAVLSGVLILLAGTSAARAADGAVDTLSSRIHFRAGSAVLDEGYRDNGRVLRTFVREVNRLLSDPGLTVVAVMVETGASPEGGAEYNERLSMDRARAVRRYLVESLPLSASQIKACSVGADWEGLAAAVRNSSCPWKEEVLAAVAASGVLVSPGAEAHDECVSRLKGIGGGQAWRWLHGNVFGELRQGAGTLRCVVTGADGILSGRPARDTLVIVHEYEGPDAEWYLGQASRRAAESSVEAVLDRLERKPHQSRNDSLLRQPALALRSNMLVPLMNMGVEVPLGNRWSVGADWYCPWAWRPLANRVFTPQSACFQLLGGSAECRCWLGPAHRGRADYRKYRLTGHSVGLLAEGGYYDFQRDWNGRQGEYAAVGIDYMYSLPLGRGGVHLEFSLALGWAFTSWRGYAVHEAGGRLMGDYGDASWNGPVPMRAGVSLAVPMFRKDGKEDFR